MKIKQIMTKKVKCVGPNVKVVEIAYILTKNRIHGIPVVDKGKVLGIITESDFFIKSLPNLYLPSYIDFLKKAKFAERITKKQKIKTNKLLESKAKDIMTNKCVTIKASANVNELINIFKTKHLFTLPVVDESDKIVGIITQADIIKLVKNINN